MIVNYDHKTFIVQATVLPFSAGYQGRGQDERRGVRREVWIPKTRCQYYKTFYDRNLQIFVII
jgi:hypothetical protein